MTTNRRHTDYTQVDKSRFFDPKSGLMIVKVLPGEHYVTSEPSEMVVTVLGSCVSACIRDPETGIGGMNHFMLPGSMSLGMSGGGAGMRYGLFAMEVLINDIIKTGCPRDRLEIKVFGGASVMGAGNQVGTQNSNFVLEYLKNEGLAVAAQDLGGMYARRIQYYPMSGKVERLVMRRQADTKVFKEEKSFAGAIDKKADDGGSIELFD